jgi:hypothetical protein
VISIDFIFDNELAQLTGATTESIQHQYYSGTGALVPILSKVGRRVGAWREEYDTWRSQSASARRAQIHLVAANGKFVANGGKAT